MPSSQEGILRQGIGIIGTVVVMWLRFTSKTEAVPFIAIQ